MDKYLDEEILVKREELKKIKFCSLEVGYYVAGKIVRFNEKNVNEYFTMYLPDNMGTMPKEFAKIKYPSAFRPKIIYTTLDLSVNMGFSMFHRKFENDEIEKICIKTMSAIKRDHRDYKFYGHHRMEKILGYKFSFRSHAMDSDLYNMMLIGQLEDYSLFVNFNCPYKDYMQWEKMVDLMWETISATEEGEK